METVRNLTCKTNPVQRARGGNAVAAAAYRAGENLREAGSNTIHRYAGRSPDVEASMIITVEGAPDWHEDRAALWNSIEARETRKDARTGRDVVLGLAWELTPEERQEAVLEFAKREFVERGHVVDIAFHKYGSAVRERDRVFDQKSGEYLSGEEKIAGWRDAGLPFLEAYQAHDVDMPHVKIERNKGGEITGHKIYHPHAHVLVSARAWDTETGDWAAQKDPYFNKPSTTMNWRYDWPKVQNKYLEAAGWDVRISCTSRLGDDALPTKSETLPNQAYHMERREYAQEPTTAQLEADFNRVQNEAVRASVEEQEETDTGALNDTPRVETANTGNWWRNMREHFTEHRDAWRDRFHSAWDRFKERWRAPGSPEQQATPETQIEAESAEIAKPRSLGPPRPPEQEL